jgi:transcriptional antiterminator
MIMDLDRNCNVTEMAEHFKVAVATIYRHLRLMNISLREHRKSMLAG